MIPRLFTGNELTIMKIRREALAVSSILFTIALLMLAPLIWGDAVSLLQSGPYESNPELYRRIDCFAPAGFASLALIVISLIVTWAGYIKRVRWTWFVMLVIVWGWAFPLLVLPLHPWRNFALFVPTLASALKETGIGRTSMEAILSFTLMALALVLPLKTFIPGRQGGHGESGRANLGATDRPNLSEKWQGGRNLTIRRDAVAASCIIFTVALLMLAPAMWRAAATARESTLWEGSSGGPQDGFAPAGIASLVVIVVGLIVTWAGYIRGVRWTWLVMFVIAWVWAFPVLLLPFLLPWRGVETMAQSFAGAISESGTERSYAEVVLAFLLMVVALVLPVKTLILGLRGGPGESGRANSGAPDKPSLSLEFLHLGLAIQHFY